MNQAATPIKQLLFFSLERWDDVWRRNQFICAGLHDRHQDLRIVWVNPPENWHHRRGTNGLSLWQVNSLPDFPRIHTLDTLKPLPNLLGRNVNNHIWWRAVSDTMQRLRFDNCAVWVNNQGMAAVVDRLQRHPLIYDITDDWAALDLTPRHRQAIRNDDQWLLAHSDNVIVCSQQLLESKQQYCQSIKLIHNGVDFDLYKPERLAQLEKPPDLAAISTPIAGYVGTLHDERVDVELLLQVSNKLPDWQFVLVGPDFLSQGSRTALTARPNVHILGARPHLQIPAYIAAFSACIVPHRITPFTDSLDPLKLYEFMSAGKPIVTTACAGFRDFGEMIDLANDSDRFAKLLQRLNSQAEPPEKIERRLSWAKQQSWQNRIAEIESYLGWTS